MYQGSDGKQVDTYDRVTGTVYSARERVVRLDEALTGRSGLPTD